MDDDEVPEFGYGGMPGIAGPRGWVTYWLWTIRAAPNDVFIPNDEIRALCWWDGVQPAAGRVQVLDVVLGRLTRAALS